MMSEQEKSWTDVFGKKFAAVSRMYAFLALTWSRMGIGAEIIDWIITHEGVSAFREAIELLGERFLKATAPVVEVMPAVPEFPIWKTIKRDAELKTVDDYRQALRGKKRGISRAVGDIINQGDLLAGGDIYDLFVLSARDLGLPTHAAPGKIYEAALGKVLEKCPIWIALAVCEEYENQPIGELLYMGIEPISDHVIGLYRSGAVTLELNVINIKSAYHATHIGNGWIFARPRKQAE